jgi:acetyl esterase/lipase
MLIGTGYVVQCDSGKRPLKADLRELDDAYSNMAYIPDGAQFPERWTRAAEAFRVAARSDLDLRYGPAERSVYDLFHPESAARGVMIFVHGGYWMEGSKDLWSHVAAGAVARGWAVAIPSYTLCPEVPIGAITRQIEAAIAHVADRVAGPIRLCGHSAGGHLTARMVCDDLAPNWRPRLEKAVPISPIADLGPLMRTSMNDTLGITRSQAADESPMRHSPCATDITVWVGGAERPAFLDQARWLADAWGCDHVVDAGRHHFDVLDGLADPKGALLEEVLG